jgi:hypothetical protein
MSDKMTNDVQQMIVGGRTYERPDDGDWWNEQGYGGAAPALNDALHEIEQLKLALIRARLALIRADEGSDQ